VRILLAFLLLAGCSSTAGGENSDFAPTELRGVAIAALCKPYAQSPSVDAERQRRGLGDCSPGDQACVKAGYPAGSSDYARCRTKEALKTNDQCYFNGPSTGRLGGPLSNADLICSRGGR